MSETSLTYLDLLILSNISEEFLEQVLDMFDEAALEVSEVRSLGKSLQLNPELILQGAHLVAAKMPKFVDSLKTNQFTDSDRMMLLGQLFEAFADHEEALESSLQAESA